MAKRKQINIEKYVEKIERKQKLENSELKNQVSLYEYLNKTCKDEDTMLGLIHHNLGTVKVDVEIPNSTEALIDKLFEIINEFKVYDIPFGEEDFIYASIINELIQINNNATEQLEAIDLEVLGISGKSPRSVIFELLKINALIEKYRESYDSINNFSLEQFLMNGLENERFSENEREIYIKPNLEKIKKNNNIPILKKVKNNE